MAIHKFQGTGVALVTPFNEDKSVDFASLKRLVEFNIDGGIDYLVVLGTTGESATLSNEEKQTVIATVLEVNNGRLPVVLGVGGNHTKAVCEQIQATDFTGIDGILSVSPYYNKPTQEGIYHHYKAIAEISPLPIILYNVPGRTSSNMTADTTLRLARDFENIIAVKEASGDMDQCMMILRDKPKDFMLISGEDTLTLPLTLLGGSGVISVIGELFPVEFSNMVNAALKGDVASAKKLHYDVLESTNLLFSEGNPAGVKAGLNIRNICKPFVRLPLIEMSDEGTEHLRQAMSPLI